MLEPILFPAIKNISPPADAPNNAQFMGVNLKPCVLADENSRLGRKDEGFFVNNFEVNAVCVSFRNICWSILYLLFIIYWIIISGVSRLYEIYKFI